MSHRASIEHQYIYSADKESWICNMTKTLAIQKLKCEKYNSQAPGL